MASKVTRRRRPRLSASDEAIADGVIRQLAEHARAERRLFTRIPESRTFRDTDGNAVVPYDDSVAQRNFEMRRLIKSGASIEECNAVRDRLVREAHVADLAKARPNRHAHVGSNEDERRRATALHLREAHPKLGERRIGEQVAKAAGAARSFHKNTVRRWLRQGGPVRSAPYPCKLCKCVDN